MVTNFLAEIRDRLKELSGSISGDFTSLEAAINALNSLIATLDDKINGLVDDVGTIKDNTTNIVLDTGEIVDAVQNIDTTTQTIASNTNAIMTSSGNTAAYAEDIATNTLENKNLCSSMAADTTEIIALLRQLVNGGGEYNLKNIDKQLYGETIEPNERKLIIFDFSDQLAEDEQIVGLKAINPTSSDPNFKYLDIRGFTTTGGSTKYQVAIYNTLDTQVTYNVNCSALVGPKPVNA